MIFMTRKVDYGASRFWPVLPCDLGHKFLTIKDRNFKFGIKIPFKCIVAIFLHQSVRLMKILREFW